MSSEYLEFHQPDPTIAKSSSSIGLSQDSDQSTLMVQATGCGKAQPISEKVFTPNGWRDIGTVSVGDHVIGWDGLPTKVVGVFPQGKKAVYCVTFSDGTNVKCCREHLWSVQTKSQKCRGAGFTTKSVDDLIGDLYDGSGCRKWFIPLVEPIDLEPIQFEIDPYVIGAMLGDGGYKHSLMFSSGDDFIVEQMCDLLPSDYVIKQRSKYDYQITVGKNLGFGVGSVLRQVLGRKGSAEKSVPRNYLYGSKSQRLDLLQGLMDTDGTVRRKERHCEFNTVSRQLAEDVQFLVRSLGGVTRVRTKKPSKYTHNGERRVGLVSYRVTVSIPDCPFRLPRKASLYNRNPNQGRTKAMVSIERCDREEDCVCISVESEDSLYVTSGFTLTHNTICMAAVANHWPIGRVMMISHRFELNDQARKTFESFCYESVDFEQGDFVADQCSISDRCRIVVASVQSLNSKRKGRYRFDKFDPNEFGLIMIDEAHRATSPTYRRAINHFLEGNSDCKLLGVTATPDRLDGVGLGHVFETVACDLNIRWGIENGWLVPVKQKFVQVDGLDFSSIKTKKNEVGESDLDKKQLSELLESESMLHEIATPIVELTGSEPTIVFTASVSQAVRLCEIINRHKPGSAMTIDGSMPPMHPERQRLIEAFKAGEYQYFVNCNIATEGFDCREVSFIAMARPTKSRSLYTQCVGRATRFLTQTGIDEAEDSTPDDRKRMIAESSKPHCTVLDFVGQAGRHSLICAGDVLAGDNDPPEIVEEARQISKKPDFDGTVLEAMELAREEARKREAARRAAVTAKAHYKTVDVETWSPSSWVPPRTIKGFEGVREPSVKMKAALKRFGFSTSEVDQMNFQQAKAMMSKCIDRMNKKLCSIKQRKLLSKFGVDATRLSFSEASKQIDAIAKNGWKRPS